MTKAEKSLQWILRLSAAVFAVAIFAVFLPTAWMVKVGEHMKVAPLPTEYPIFQYLARSESLLYALLGGICWIVSMDLRRYRPLVIYLSATGLLYASIMCPIDFIFKMPLRWSTHEGPMVFLFSLLMLWLSFKIQKQ
jgi:hypothetical protein